MSVRVWNEVQSRCKIGLSVACSVAILLAACGGGGSDSGGGTASSPPPTLARLNDTGVTADQCFAAGSAAFVACSSPEARTLSTRQDGQVGRDAVAATNASSDGKLGFQFSAVQGGCVRDEVTGLTWEPKTADGGLHDGKRTYTYVGDLRPGDASEFVRSVNIEGLCGAADWRVPTFQELDSLVDYGARAAKPYPGDGGVWIDTTWFPNTGVIYWTSDSFVEFGPRGFSPHPGDRSPVFGSPYAVRLVRGGNAFVAAETRFTPSADAQEVTDRQTGLVWRRCLEGTQYVAGSCPGTFSLLTHEDALRLAATVAASTGIGWRLPNAKELLGLTPPGREAPTLDPIAFPVTPAVPVTRTTPRSAWASTPCSPGAAVYSNFDSPGGTGATFCKARGIGDYVLLVRDPS